jgi:hypothetical protein
MKSRNVEDVFLGVAWGRNPKIGVTRAEIRGTNEQERAGRGVVDPGGVVLA